MTSSKPNALIGECLAEFIGTGLLIFFGVGCVAAMKLTGADFGQWEISIMWGLGVAIAIYVTAGVSGAHLNPAVTIALASFHGFNKRKVLPYIMAQVLGAFAAAALIYGLYSNLFTDYETSHNIIRGTVASLDTASIFSTFPHPSLSFSGAFAVEFTITAVLMFAILAIGDDKNGAPRGAMGPLLIGLLIAVIGGSLGPLTGFAMNPARDFGPKLLTFFAGWDSVALTGAKDIPYFIVPILAPICGALFGGWAYPKLMGIYLPGNKCTLPNKCETNTDTPKVEA
ncbi:MIP family channel protein [Photobacterium phosphoreum]|mgnify:FL=1|jgi:glycerol uptake facilitator protein|uniref:MIP family channel protein n=1 Tax=Photobacterium phosphoreum TaxID=659 RepID=A0AAW4ZWU0_PHOPO|nr:MIP/aquaporin family protein [Photobacterium phosphoreum]MCD9463493.1 aquaporin family protein [Photobacterium phosphoreum]MCD9471454.1 aquaporin family protein [Photobacterium phosphoreum]MCD9476014.1 MIP family channel protein [Photobacterium phosphoreum]MCD9479764.1 MIP family channel protein [Photobacterium phosphoreum]MCD9483843.1 MIP family channel protein [Photobacterium phosphoreum]